MARRTVDIDVNSILPALELRLTGVKCLGLRYWVAAPVLRLGARIAGGNLRAEWG